MRSRLHRVLPLGAVAAILACGEQTLAPVPHEEAVPPAIPFTASEPVRSPLAAGFAGVGLEDGQSFVSLRPGTLPDGETVTVLNPRNGFSGEYPLVDGGLDPVPVPASVGDSIVLRVPLPGGGFLQAARMVSAELNPRIVRTRPPAKKRDVPLNAVIEVVFSEPMREDLLDGAVTLLRGGEPVPTTKRFRDASRTLVELVPIAELDPVTEYLLVVSREARDLGGAPLEAGVDVDFTTQAAPEPLLLRAVSAGADHTCGLTADGRLVCWGATVGPGGPVLLSPAGLDGVAAGGSSICGFGSTVLCIAGDPWVLGMKDGGPQDGTFPDDFALLSAGGDHVCGILEDGGIRCWGVHRVTSFQRFYVGGPHPVESDSALVMLASGAEHDCGLTAGGKAYCWGNADLGQLGSYARTYEVTDTLIFRAWPVQTDLRFRTLAAGGNGTCGITLDGDLYCWGDLIGKTYYSVEPVHVPAPVSFVSVHLGDAHACGLDDAGRAWCWGEERTEAGLVVREAPETPQASTFVALSAGARHTCGIAPDRSVFCWGDNGSGQLGDGTTISSGSPVKVILRP